MYNCMFEDKCKNVNTYLCLNCINSYDMSDNFEEVEEQKDNVIFVDFVHKVVIC